MKALSLAAVVVARLVAVATATDLRARRVPIWLTLGGIVGGLCLAVSSGPVALHQSVLGLGVGMGVLLPLVLLGGFGWGDALLLGTIGAWQGGWFVLVTAFWMAMAGAVLALLFAWRKHRTLPYVPAIAIGALIALMTT